MNANFAWTVLLLLLAAVGGIASAAPSDAVVAPSSAAADRRRAEPAPSAAGAAPSPPSLRIVNDPVDGSAEIAAAFPSVRGAIASSRIEGPRSRGGGIVTVRRVT